jgi:hypothetical protein
MKPPRSLRSLPPKGAECRGSESACADLDGTKDSRAPRLEVRTFGTAGRH